MVRTLLIALLVFGMTACKDEKKKDKEDKEEKSSVDLSSAEAAGKTIQTALENDDKETFQKCLSPRLQKKTKACEGDTSERCQKRHSLDALFNNWKSELPTIQKEDFHLPSLKEFDGKWRLDDSKSSVESSVDLSSAEAAGKTIQTALENDDKETFQKCLSPRLQKKTKACEGDTSERCQKRHSLDALFNNWKSFLPTIQKEGFPLTSLKKFHVRNRASRWRLDDS